MYGTYNVKVIAKIVARNCSQCGIVKCPAMISKGKEGTFATYQMRLLEQVPKTVEREFMTILYGRFTVL
jgi:hypothetical protein